MTPEERATDILRRCWIDRTKIENADVLFLGLDVEIARGCRNREHVGEKMSTWNRKSRAAMGEFQRKKRQPKRQVLCSKCSKIHDHPVCKRSAP